MKRTIKILSTGIAISLSLHSVSARADIGDSIAEFFNNIGNELDGEPHNTQKTPPKVKPPVRRTAPATPPALTQRKSKNDDFSIDAPSDDQATPVTKTPRSSRPLAPPPQLVDNTPAAPAPTNELNAIGLAIQSQLSRSGDITIGSQQLNSAQVRQLYSLNANHPYLVDENGLTPLGIAVQAMITREAEFHGFERENYFTADTQSRLASKDPRTLAQLDILLVNGYASLAKDMASGRTNPKDPSQNLADIELTQQPAPKASTLHNALSSDPAAMQAGIRSLSPHTISYVKLLEVLEVMQNARKAGGWPALGDRSTIHQGETNANVPGIRMRLVDMGLMPKEERSNTSSVYDDAVVKGIMRLQKVMFLPKVDGIAGAQTYSVLSVPLEDRIVQIKANLERWRLLPRDLGSKFLFVDLGRQALDVMVDNKLVERMRVVVGRDLNGTPTMIDSVQRININPYWRAPKSIVTKEMIPHYLQDQSYFEKNHIRIISSRGEIDPSQIDWSNYSVDNPPPYEFRQDTGPENSLGVLKFSLNNAHAIYMHDTDHKEAFLEAVRYMSHGCIRLQKPLDLAAYLLQDQGIDKAAIQAMIANPDNLDKPIKLTTPMRVYIFGTTMVTYNDGSVGFGEDVYKQDQRIVDALTGRHRNAAVVPATSQAQDSATVQVAPIR